MSALHFFPNLMRDGAAKLPQLGAVPSRVSRFAVFFRQPANNSIDGTAETIVRMMADHRGGSGSGIQWVTWHLRSSSSLNHMVS